MRYQYFISNFSERRRQLDLGKREGLRKGSPKRLGSTHNQATTNKNTDHSGRSKFLLCRCARMRSLMKNKVECKIRSTNRKRVSM